MVISRTDWDQWRWLQDCDDADEQANKPKPFEHREMASKCGSCRMLVKMRGRDVCLASGKPVTPESGTGSCAFEAKNA